jgi:hypothetical protein
MGRVGCDFRVAARGVERTRRQRGLVVRVDDVVREPGVIGVLPEERLAVAFI